MFQWLQYLSCLPKSMSEPIITIENLSKRYLIGHQQMTGDGLRHVIEGALRNPLSLLQKKGRGRRTEREEFWALSDISFEVEQGEVVGIVGRNGAGKSTILKILSRITEPTIGRVRIKGRVASLLEVGTGFHQELTGRENIFLNGAILGMTRAEIRRKFDEIVAFSEVEMFLDTPVKHYSSGMYVRLAFAVAAHLEPDILIIDEVLAVGDGAFQRKCLGKMNEVSRQGRTVLFVSHNMAAITSLCTRGLLIESGRLVLSESPQVVVEEYLSKSSAYSERPLSERMDRTGNGRVRFTKISVLNHRNEAVECVTSGQGISICIEYDLADAQEIKNAYFQITVSGVHGKPIFGCLSRVTNGGVLTLTPGARILCHIPCLPLLPGLYTYSIWCKAGLAPGTLEDSLTDAGKLSVVAGDYFGTGQLHSNQLGEFLVTHNWSVEEKTE
jgi:lipopolysaccharide transport system ATP-binding protein